MSATKIKYWEADTIAARIANEAMKHLTGPIEQKINGICLRGYTELLDGFAITGREREFIDAGLLTESSVARIVFLDGEDGKLECFSSAGMNKLLLSPGTYGNWRISNETLIAEYLELVRERTLLLMKRESLKQELKSQIEGKSAKHVMKTWPEAAQFVGAEFGIHPETGKDVTMTTPLEQLLAKYLPMLPAPQGV